MSATVRQAGSGWATSGVNLTLSTAQTPLSLSVTAGNMLVVTANQETALNDITGITDSGGNTWVADVANSADAQGLGRCVFRCQSVGTVPTWIKVSATTSGTIFYTFTEMAGLHATPFENYFSVVDGATVTTHAPAFSAATSNASAVCLTTSGGDQGTITPTNGFTEIPTTRNGRAAFYIADLGASGSKTLGYSSTSANNVNHLIAVYKSAITDPTVSTVTGTTVTEGGSIVYTVTLSGATNRTTNYAASFTGGTATSADYDSDLGNATYSAGVTFIGGNMVVPTAVSSFTFTVATTQDTLDEADETVFPTVGGVAAVTGTITDNDPIPAINLPAPVTVDGGDSVVLEYPIPVPSGRTTQARLVITNGTKTGGVDFENVLNNYTYAGVGGNVTQSGGVLTIDPLVTLVRITIPTTP